jgi:hypothetical protein
MHRLSHYVPLLLVPATAVIVACGDSNPASPTAPAAVEAALVTVEPQTATPEFLPISFCPAGRPFGVRLVITIGGRASVTVRRLHFDFTDRSGRVTAPLLIPTAGSIPSSMPVPIPGPTTIPSSSIPIPSSSPVPIPRSSPIENVTIAAGVPRTLPLFLEFDCDVPAAGTLAVRVDTTDARGTFETSQVLVRVGS